MHRDPFCRAGVLPSITDPNYPPLLARPVLSGRCSSLDKRPKLPYTPRETRSVGSVLFFDKRPKLPYTPRRPKLLRYYGTSTSKVPYTTVGFGSTNTIHTVHTGYILPYVRYINKQEIRRVDRKTDDR